MCGFWGSPGAVSLSKRPSKLSVLFIASKQGLLRRAVIQWHEGKNHMFRAQQDPTRLHVDGLRGHAGAHAIMVADSDSVELATFQVLYPAAGVSGAAAEKSLIFIHNAGSVGVHSGLSMPRNQSLIGCTVQGGSDVIRGASSWNEAKGQLTSTMKQNIIRLCTFLKWNTDTEFNHENQQLKILIKNSSVLSVFAQKLCVNNNNISFWDLQIWKFAFNPFNILQIVYTSLFSPSREHLRHLSSYTVKEEKWAASQYLSLWWPSCSQSCCTWSWRQWRTLCSWCCTSSPRSYRSNPWSCSCEWRHCCPSPWRRRKLHCRTSRSLWWSRLHIPSLLIRSKERRGLEERGQIKLRINSTFKPFHSCRGSELRLPVHPEVYNHNNTWLMP